MGLSALTFASHVAAGMAEGKAESASCSLEALAKKRGESGLGVGMQPISFGGGNGVRVRRENKRDVSA
jgi:hypothetical protein